MTSSTTPPQARSAYEHLMPCTVAAIDVGGTKIAGALIRYENASDAPVVFFEETIPTEAARGGDYVLHAIEGLCERLLEEASRQQAPASAIGVGTAGRVDAQTGAIAYANDIMPGWTGQPLRKHLQDTLDLPTAVLNDVQAHALGEARWGAARDASHCIVVAAGTGLGGAIIADGRVLRGTHGFAGELGHTFHPAAAGITCACGHDAHLESIASGGGIEACYAREGGEALSGAEISERATKGESLARRIIEQAGFSLGSSIGTWASMLDPEIVVVSGSVAKAGAVWHDALMSGFESQLPGGQEKLPIVEAKLGGQAPLIGAAEHALDTLAECD